MMHGRKNIKFHSWFVLGVQLHILKQAKHKTNNTRCGVVLITQHIWNVSCIWQISVSIRKVDCLKPTCSYCWNHSLNASLLNACEMKFKKKREKKEDFWHIVQEMKCKNTNMEIVKLFFTVLKIWRGKCNLNTALQGDPICCFQHLWNLTLYKLHLHTSAICILTTRRIFQFKFRSILLFFSLLNCYQMSLAYRLLIAGSCYKH